MLAFLIGKRNEKRELFAELSWIPFASDINLQVAMLEPEIDVIGLDSGIKLLADLRRS